MLCCKPVPRRRPPSPGLLPLLYPQRIAHIVKLTTDHVHDDGGQVKVMLGTSPVVLPEPLADLVREVLATRQGHATIGRPDTTPWLFPGGRPDQHIGDWMTYAADVSSRLRSGNQNSSPIDRQPQEPGRHIE